MKFLLSFVFFIFTSLHVLEAVTPNNEFPVLYRGRYRPAEEYGRLWLQDEGHEVDLNLDSIKIGISKHSPLSILWQLEMSGSTSDEEILKARVSELKERLVPPQEISNLLERELPISKRLRMSGLLFLTLPSRLSPGEWLPLHALAVMIFDPKENALTPVGNFTVYPDEQFYAMQTTYLGLKQAFRQQTPDLEDKQVELGQLLYEAYGSSLAGRVYQSANEKQLFYPTLNQLKAERVFISFPWISLLIVLYSLATLILFIAYSFSNILLTKTGCLILISAFLIHTMLLGLRIYILERPPVSNMFETVIYVPWISTLTALLIPFFRKQTLTLIAAALSSVILLIVLEVTKLHQSLDQVQAVLDSQFWLTTHVLMVVGSYGLFLFASLLGHFYLGIYLIQKKSPQSLAWLAQRILQILYGGTLFLITGTILGGVWAAESWGRFWDWDPKESWAFISSCSYLIWIHAYRFGKIADFGLAIGAVAGFLAISFTWYGVNYLLGTGLHTYGFGSGGESIYYLFCGVELLFINFALWRRPPKVTRPSRP